jgi:hypothetical protein
MAANQTLNRNLFTWGDAVQVCPSAPEGLRPNAYGSVCGMRQICPDAEAPFVPAAECHYLYTVEYIDGASAEIPEELLQIDVEAQSFPH